MRKSYAQFFSVIKIFCSSFLFVSFFIHFLTNIKITNKTKIKADSSAFLFFTIGELKSDPFNSLNYVTVQQSDNRSDRAFCRHRRYAYWNECITDTEMLKQHKTARQDHNFFIFIYAFTRWGRGVWKLWLRRQRYIPSIFCLPQLFRMSDSHHNYEKST